MCKSEQVEKANILTKGVRCMRMTETKNEADEEMRRFSAFSSTRRL